MFEKKKISEILFYKMKLKKYFPLLQAYLLKKKIPQPYPSFQTIYEEALKKSLICKKKQTQNMMTHSLVKKMYYIQKMLRLRSRHYPIQYICKEWPFRQIVLKMRPPILIPRFQTEQLISILFQKLDELKYFQKHKQSQGKKLVFKFTELGCGTGAIGLSIIDQLVKRNIQFQGTMIDIQAKAVQLTKKNLIKNGFQIYRQNIKIFEQNMIQLLQQKQNFENLSLLISNPPYISKKQYKSKKFQKQVKKYQSKVALIGDENLNQNGLYYIQKIILKWKQNQKFILALQYGGENLEYIGCEIQKCVLEDYYKKRRFIILFPK